MIQYIMAGMIEVACFEHPSGKMVKFYPSTHFSRLHDSLFLSETALLGFGRTQASHVFKESCLRLSL
jgi:hypothetical protein